MVRAAAPLLAVCLSAPAGCIRKTLEISSEPAGAQVMVNGQPAGDTPVRFEFLHHGTYRVELRKPGFEPVVDGLRLRPKLYEYPPADFLFGVVLPGTRRDERRMHYELKPLEPLNAAKALAAARDAAAEAEKVIPRLYALPPANPRAKDRALLQGPDGRARSERGDGSSSPPGEARPPRPPREPAAAPQNPLPAPGDVPEIEEGRDR
jgi:hypothetical protein